MTSEPDAPLLAGFFQGSLGPAPPLLPYLAAFAVLAVALPIARRRSWPISFRRALLFFLLFSGLAVAAAALPADLVRPARPWLLVLGRMLAWVGLFETAQGAIFDLLLGGLLRRPPVPRILRDFLTITLSLTALFFTLRGALGVNLTSLLATSAMLSLVLGLALQETLGSFFSGLALQMEKPFAIGDWVSIGAHTGRVTQNAWRAVRIATLEGDEVTLPNAAVAREVLLNHSRPGAAHLHFISVGAPVEHPPARVIAALVDATRCVPGVLEDPAPSALLWEFGASEIVYRARFWISDYQRVNAIASDVAVRVWYRLRREGIDLPYPVRVIQRQAAPPSSAAEAERIARALGAVDVFAPLSEGELSLLAHEVRPRLYDRGEAVVRQGDGGDSLFIVTAGRVEVRVAEGGETGVVGELGAGSVFGEMSLLTGNPRAATVVALEETELLPVTREDFRRIAASNPAVLEAVTRVVSGRRTQLAETIRETGEAAAARSGHSDLLARVRCFFGV